MMEELPTSCGAGGCGVERGEDAGEASTEAAASPGAAARKASALSIANGLAREHSAGRGARFPGTGKKLPSLVNCHSGARRSWRYDGVATRLGMHRQAAGAARRARCALRCGRGGATLRCGAPCGRAGARRHSSAVQPGGAAGAPAARARIGRASPPRVCLRRRFRLAPSRLAGCRLGGPRDAAAAAVGVMSGAWCCRGSAKQRGGSRSTSADGSCFRFRVVVFLFAQTWECRELLDAAADVAQGKAPAAPDAGRSVEERRVRRGRALAREAAELAQAAQAARERDALEPAYAAKAQAELFEAKQARAEGASPEEAAKRAETAGALAFATASQDVQAQQAAVDAYEARQEEKRKAAAAKAAAEDAARAAQVEALTQAAAARAAAEDAAAAAAQGTRAAAQ